MKFLHTGDLHIGKTVNEFSMLEDQQFVLNQIVELAKREKADAVVLAGDIYDRSIPSTEAVRVLDDFLTRLVLEKIPVLMVSGNHDSPERVGFVGGILEKQGLYIAGMAENPLKQVVFQEENVETVFVLLPFVKPAAVGAKDSRMAVEKLLKTVPIEKKTGDGRTRRYVLVTHFFVTAADGQQPELSDSETVVNVGGLDSVPAEVFKAYDYVALGHIHKPQRVGENKIQYAGTPLKYSFSETEQSKGINLVTLEETVTVEQLPLKPLHEMRKIKGSLKELIRPEVAETADCMDYIQATLTDTEELIDPIGTLRCVYPNIMQLQLLKNEEKDAGEYETKLNIRRKSAMELFSEFYELVKQEPMDERRTAIVREALEGLE